MNHYIVALYYLMYLTLSHYYRYRIRPPPYTDVSENKPDVSENKPDVSENKPDVRENKPDVSENKPDVSENKPDVSENKPDVSENKPDVSENKPDVSENKPDVSKNKPEFSENKPDVSENKPVSEPVVVPEQSYGAIVLRFAAKVKQQSYLHRAIILCFIAVIIALIFKVS